MLVSSGKTIITDQKFDSDESNSRFSNYVFIRLVAGRRTFTKVDFKSYYRSHHSGALLRTLAFLEWLKFKTLDFVWGNGENLFRLIRSVFIVVALMTILDVVIDGDPGQVQSYFVSLWRSFEIFFGTLTPNDYWKGYLALITCVRLVAVGFFLSIIIKKFSRR